jgi:hypothetical protein
MALNQAFVKVLIGEAKIALAIKRLHLRLARRGNALARRLGEPPVHKSRLARLLKAIAPTPKRPLPDAQKLRRFHLSELRRLVAAQNVHELDHPHTLKGFRPAHPKPSNGPHCYRTD